MSRIALVDPTTLLGEELSRHLEFDGLDQPPTLIGTDPEEIGTLTESAGTAGLVMPFDVENPPAVDLLVVCSSEAKRASEIVEHRAPETGVLFVSPDAGADCGPALISGVSPEELFDRPLLRAAHPAAVLVARLARALAPLGATHLAATVIQPVSVAGRSEVLDELLSETRSLLAFEARAEDAPPQRSFNILPGDAPDGPSGAELAAIVAGALGETPRTAIQLLSGGLFHALAASVHVLWDRPPTGEELEDVLARAEGIELRSEPAPLGAIDAAGSDRILCAPPTSDGADGHWLWLTADNLVLGAGNAAELIETLLQRD